MNAINKNNSIMNEDEIEALSDSATIVKGFFQEIDSYSEKFDEEFDHLLDVTQVDKEVISDERSIEDFSDDEINNMNLATRLIKAIQDCALAYVDDKINKINKE